MAFELLHRKGRDLTLYALNTGEVEHTAYSWALFDNIMAPFFKQHFKSITEQEKEVNAIHLYIIT